MLTPHRISNATRSAEVVARAPEVDADRLFKLRNLVASHIKQGTLKNYLTFLASGMHEDKDGDEAKLRRCQATAIYDSLKFPALADLWKGVLLEKEGLASQGYEHLRFGFEPNLLDGEKDDAEWTQHPLDTLLALTQRDLFLMLNEALEPCKEACAAFDRLELSNSMELLKKASEVVSSIPTISVVVSSIPTTSSGMPELERDLFVEAVTFLATLEDGSLETVLGEYQQDCPADKLLRDYILEVAPPENEKTEMTLKEKVGVAFRRIGAMLELLGNKIYSVLEVGATYSDLTCSRLLLARFMRVNDEILKSEKTLEEKCRLVSQKFKEADRIVGKAEHATPGVSELLVYYRCKMMADAHQNLVHWEERKKTHALPSIFSEPQRERTVHYGSYVRYRLEAINALLRLEVLVPRASRITTNAFCRDERGCFTDDLHRAFNLESLMNGTGVEARLNVYSEEPIAGRLGFNVLIAGMREGIAEEYGIGYCAPRSASPC